MLGLIEIDLYLWTEFEPRRERDLSTKADRVGSMILSNDAGRVELALMEYCRNNSENESHSTVSDIT